MRKREGSSPSPRTSFEGNHLKNIKFKLFIGPQMSNKKDSLNNIFDPSIPTSPLKTDSLFKSEKDFHLNACLNWMHDSLPAYADGYKRAADLLCTQIIESNAGPIDTLIYPLCSLYRHYIELRLKEIIKDGYLIFDIRQGVPTHHKIVKLWKEAKSFTLKIWPDGPKEELENLERLLVEFEKADPGAQDFRYPTNKDGENSLKGITHINIRNLQEVMSRVGFLLDGISMGIGEARSHAEYASQWER